MLFDLRYRYLPAQHRMALRAVRSEFPPVNVCVAVRTILAYVREHRLYVAFRAFHFFVHATQRVVRFVVIEFRHRADRPPSCSRVAVFAGYGQ